VGCSNSGSLPSTLPPTPPPEVVEAATVVLINELCPANRSIVSDEAGEFDDWLELFNPGAEPVDLGGWTLGAEDANDPWSLPEGLEIGAGGHLVLWADRNLDQGGRHIDMGLDADGDSVALRRPDGSVADLWTFGPVLPDLVLGRFPDAGPGTFTSIFATPGAPNPTDPGLSRDRSEVLFPTDRVLRFDLYLDDENRQRLLEDNDARGEAELVFQGAYFPRVELLIKGQLGSRRTFDQKAAFRVDLDEFVPGTRLRGQENLTFNNMVQDPSGVAETAFLGR
jgi:hypothetical protein